MIPEWLHVLSFISIFLGIACAVAIAVDEWRHPQHMWIMAIVWPVTALFGSVIALWGYRVYGRLDSRAAINSGKGRDDAPTRKRPPFPIAVGKATCHCGAGCCLGDIAAEWIAFSLPVVAITLGWTVLFDEKMFAVWILDYAFAFVLGIAFQYFSIKPMRNLSPAEGLVRAVKADALSLSAWQVGMFGFMAFAQFHLFRHVLAARLTVDSAEFWFMMQLAMLMGFVTSYPVNWWLIRTGVKERM